MDRDGVTRNGVVDRLACVECHSFPLQILLKSCPEWTTRPVAVVNYDKPHGVILWVNELARASRICPGMRYSAGLSLEHTLQAGVVSTIEMQQATSMLAKHLRKFSPEIEPCSDEPGVFWLNASGLSHLYESYRQWAMEVVTTLKACGFRAGVTIGFTRFGSYAIAKKNSATPSITIVKNCAHERILAGKVPLDCLGVNADLRDALQKLGVKTVDAFLQLPAAGICRRFGKKAQRLHELAAGDFCVPLQRLHFKKPLVQHVEFDEPEINTSCLLVNIKGLLKRLLLIVTSHHEALTELLLSLCLDRSGTRTERIRPAAPTININQLMELVRLRLESLTLQAGVTEVWVSARTVQTTAVQQELFVKRSCRDVVTANRVLARIRSEFGNDVVVGARLTEGHLPEDQFVWDCGMPVSCAEPRNIAHRPMVRRIHLNPVLLQSRSLNGSSGWQASGSEVRYMKALIGPYLVSGGWWRSIVHREYYFAKMCDGDVLWIYYDKPQQQWYWQGQVE